MSKNKVSTHAHEITNESVKSKIDELSHSSRRPPTSVQKIIPLFQEEEEDRLLTAETVENSSSVFPSEARFPISPMPEVVAQEKRGWLARVMQLLNGEQSFKARLRALPVIGYGFAWFNALIKIGVTRHHHTVELEMLRQQNYFLLQQIHALNQRVSQIEPVINDTVIHLVHQIQKVEKKNLERFQHVTQRINAFEEEKIITRLHRYDTLAVGERLMKLEQLEMARKLKQFTTILRTQNFDEVKINQQLAIVNERIEALELREDTSQLREKKLASELVQSSFNQDEFYVDFENKFRGGKEEIQQRLTVYLPYLADIQKIKETDRSLWVDVGCGRGEWLALMAEQCIPAIGVDLNGAMVDACIADGYAARSADAITYLLEQKAGSIGGITGFHIIEHLPFEQLIALFDAALYALKDGGVVIFETPNPENLIIGACNFYYDPTHLHPIVPDVAQFIAKQRGFKKVEILRLHPFPEDYQMSGNSQLDETLNKFLFSSQDYAVIAWK